MSPDRCLICGQASPSLEIHRENVNLLERQLNAVFVLRELLQLPENSLETWLLSSGGDNPASWITICGGPCQKIVENARTAYREMQTARQKLQACQTEIRDKICLSSSAVISVEQHTDFRTEIWGTVREVARQNNFLETDDFAAGDRMADQMLAILNQPKPIPDFIVQKLELESCSESEMVDDFAEEPQAVRTDLAASFPCDLCDKAFTSSQRLAKHQSNCHMPKTLKSCPYCDYTTPHTRFTLNRHIRIRHEKSKIWRCEMCRQECNQPRALSQHQAFHHNKCSVKDCGKVCGSQQNLRDHQVKGHGKEVDVFQCPECGHLCRARSVLRDHLQTTHPKKGAAEAKHVCSHCGRAYVTGNQLTKHIYKKHNKNDTKSPAVNDIILGI